MLSKAGDQHFAKNAGVTVRGIERGPYPKVVKIIEVNLVAPISYKPQEWGRFLKDNMYISDIMDRIYNNLSFLREMNIFSETNTATSCRGYRM